MVPGKANTVIGDLLSEVTLLDEHLAQYGVHIQAMAKGNERTHQPMRLGGGDPSTGGSPRIGTGCLPD